MTRIYGERAQNLRELFDATPDEKLKAQTLYERMGVADVGQAKERTNIRNTLPSLVRCGFLVKVGSGPEATYQSSGKAKKRPKATEAELAERKRERNALRTAVALVRSRAARVELQAANTPVPTKPKTVAPGETVEQFEARGGRVEILPTHWDRVAA